jgi:HSP20 family protein
MTIAHVTRRPASLSPWQEMGNASLRLNRLFGLAGNGPGSADGWNPAVNVEETDDALLLSAELPGMNIEGLELGVKDNVLTVQGEKNLWERSFGSFRRTFTLPRTVVTDDISAEFKDGILFIQLPKAPEAKSRKISIQAEG